MGTKTVTSVEGRGVPTSIHYGPDNPHPLARLTTELVWEGKYDDYGRRREVDIAGAALPLQKIETIDEPRSRAEADCSAQFYEQGRIYSGWRPYSRCV